MVLAEMRGQGLARLQHPHATLRVDRYASLKVARPPRVLPLLAERLWVDETVPVKGRRLHALASRDADAMAALRPFAQEETHESLVVRRLRPGGG